LQAKDSERPVNPLGKEDPEFKIDLGTIVFVIIGSIVSWINMLTILFYLKGNYESIIIILAFLSVIFTVIIPGMIIGMKNRFWGYGYIFGFAIAGIPFSFVGDLFIGWYTFATAIFIFIIIWLIFWKTWRSLASIRTKN